MFNYNITFTHTSIPSTENAYRTPYTKEQVKPEPITSPPRKKSRTTFGSLINDSKEDEEWTCSNEIGNGGGEEFDVTTMQGNIEEKLEPNLD